MDKTKKDVEERMLSSFVSNKSLRMRIAGITPMDPPDFKISRYVNKQFKEIGVEITRVINPNLKEGESAQERIVNLAHERFKKELSDKLVVYVNFSRTPFSYRSESLNEISNFLFELVKDVAEKNRGYKFRAETKRIVLHPVFESITIKNDEGYGFENWQPFGAFRVPYIDETWFAEIIRKKELKISGYPESFDEKWLVLISNFGHESSHFEFTNLKKDFRDSPFNRIFIYKYREDEVIKVKY
jgi:hypothetical protein